MRCHERPDVVSSRREVVKPPVAFTVLARRRGNGPVRAEENVQRLDVPRETVTTGLGIRFHASPGLEERASAFMLGEEFEEANASFSLFSFDVGRILHDAGVGAASVEQDGAEEAGVGDPGIVSVLCQKPSV